MTFSKGQLLPTLYERDKTIDVAKGCGILLVVFGHVCHIHPFWSIIYSFHMPLFFFIAGMNFHPEKYLTFATFIRKKAHTMILPYLFFCLLGILYQLLYQVVSGVPKDQLIDYLLQLPYAVVWMPYSKFSELFNTPLWFVPCLLLLECMFYYLDRIQNRYLFGATVIILAAMGWAMELPHSPYDFTFLPWNFSSACFALIFFAVGNRARGTIKEWILHPQMTRKRTAIMLLAFSLCFLITGYVGAHNSASLGSRELNNGFLFVLTGFTGTLCVLIGARFLKSSRILNYFGKNSFAVMGCQIPIYWAILTLIDFLHQNWSDRIPVYTEASIMQCVAMFILISFLCSLFTLVYNGCRNLHSERRTQHSDG